MMKKVMFALCFVFGGIVAVSAQETQSQDTTSNQYRTETESQNAQDAQGQDQPQDAQGQDQSQEMQPQDQSQNMGQQDRERIQVTELPEEVKRSLEGQEYRGWLISGAFKAQGGESGDQSTQDQSAMQSDTTSAQGREPSTNATGAEGEEVFIVELKNGAETKTVRFDSNGQVVEGSEAEQSSQYNQSEPMGQPESQPNRTEQPDQSQSSETETAQPDQSTEQSTETDTEQSSQRQNDQSTETQSTDQSKANEPK